MNSEKKKKIIKTIVIDADKCNGCRACEMICSYIHSIPKYTSNNPARSRIRINYNALKDIYLPIYAGNYTPSECIGRTKYIINKKEYEECTFCRDSCSARVFFKEPDSNLPLKCDMCENDLSLLEPMCVQWCLVDALRYEKREEDIEDIENMKDIEELEIGLESLADKFGLDKVINIVARMKISITD